MSKNKTSAKNYNIIKVIKKNRKTNKKVILTHSEKVVHIHYAFYKFYKFTFI